MGAVLFVAAGRGRARDVLGGEGAFLRLGSLACFAGLRLLLIDRNLSAPTCPLADRFLTAVGGRKALIALVDGTTLAPG